MSTSVRSFAKINIGLKIGPLGEDGFHELRTIYQTVALSDLVRVDVSKGVGIDIVCKDSACPRTRAIPAGASPTGCCGDSRSGGKCGFPSKKTSPCRAGWA